MTDIGIGDVATSISTVVAIAAAFVAHRASKAADRHQQEAATYAKKNAEILEQQHQLELRSWIDQHFSGVREWADQVCSAISEALHIIDHPDEDAQRRTDVLIRLSALADTGRWYFPNQWSEQYGTHKEAAYRGVRQPVLDCVVDAYDCLKNSAQNDGRELLLETQRRFVSYIQISLAPHKRAQEIREALARSEASERPRGVSGLQ